ncbi:MAG: DUF4270 domain-containing protein [Bacteroidales bacterium]|nr:DUF4270 domain-containing protein [Bacteroidales bacterium]
MTKSKLSGLMLTIILAGIMFACSNDTSFTIGEDLTDIKSSVIVVDTTTIISYTIKADSLQTSGYSKALAGRYSDGAFGTVTASSYFQLALPSSLSIDENSRYDSICLILKPTGYCYGDSTKDYTLQVHKLAEDLDNDDITFRYNVSEVSYFSEILGSKTTVFRPSSGREFTVKLSDTFGALLLSKNFK